MAQNFKSIALGVWAKIKRIAAAVWEYLKVAKMEWIVLVGFFAFDLISKAIVEATVDFGGTVTLIPYFLNIHRLHNYKAAFGADFLSSWFGPVGARIFYSVFAVAASVAFILVLIKQKGRSKLFRIGIALFVAGALGNCIDRMALGYVRDFIEFVYFGLTIAGRTSWYVFNIADAALVVGVILMVIYLLFFYKEKKPENKEMLTGEQEEAPVDLSQNSASPDGKPQGVDEPQDGEQQQDGEPPQAERPLTEESTSFSGEPEPSSEPEAAGEAEEQPLTEEPERSEMPSDWSEE